MKIWIPKYKFHKYGKNGLFLETPGNLVLSHQKHGSPHSPTVIPFLLVDSCHKNKTFCGRGEVCFEMPDLRGTLKQTFSTAA